VSGGVAGVIDEFDPREAAPSGGVGLCLSGGGHRAMLFHLGALRRLNEAGQLAAVTRVASVSGGSIIAGLLGMRWTELEFVEIGSGLVVAQRFNAEPRLLAYDSDESGSISGTCWQCVHRRAAQSLVGGVTEGTPRYAWRETAVWLTRVQPQPPAHAASRPAWVSRSSLCETGTALLVTGRRFQPRLSAWRNLRPTSRAVMSAGLAGGSGRYE